MLSASFTSGLLGEAGKFTRFNLSANMNEALKIATTVNQAQIQERRNESFYVDEPRTRRQSGRAFSRQ
jgi:urocanate hydratase